MGIDSGLHLLDSVEPALPSFDTEVLVQEGAMDALDDAVIRYEVCGADRRPRPSESGCSEPT